MESTIESTIEDPFNRFGLMAPWEESEDKEKYIQRHSDSLITIIIFLVIEGIIILLIIGRYPMDNVTSTILFFTVAWMLGGVLGIWYTWIHGHNSWSIGLAVIFVTVNVLLVWFTLELRYQEFYAKYPNLVRDFFR